MDIPSHIGIIKNKKAYNLGNHATILITKKTINTSANNIEIIYS